MNKRQYLILFLSFFLVIVIIRLLIMSNNSDGSITNNNNGLPDQISYNFHVKPILSDKCFACHGPDANKRKAGLRLDVEKDALLELTENQGKYAIIPGRPDASELITRIFTEDQNQIMPPIDSHLKLNEEEKNILRKWIEQGAEYERHWSFIPPEKSELPNIANDQMASNEIDFFVFKELDNIGLEPANEAIPERLLRRISLDITGLPPTTNDLSRFIIDNRLDYEQAINYYLSQPAFGEKMALDWMDLSRYADSHGYQDDSYRTMWPWRDWVIHAFNENMPYNQFLVWQLAGDLIPNATKAQILATGFNRNHPITQEGGVIDEEYRSTYVSDRTNTLGKGILGLTLECAKCHDHKYDPISQKDYFSLYAFFNQVNEKGLQMDAVQAKNRKYYADAPYIQVKDDDLEGILSFINKEDTAELKVMVMNDSTERETFVLARGNYDSPAEKVEPIAPEIIMGYPEGLPQNRLGLAKWLTDNKNPLTARVYVNRLWSGFFGQGIVKTIEDFGSQGALPSHPELLDWLAVDFIEHNWDTKYIIKKIMMSSTYRQSSVITKRKKERDPENIYLSRGPRFRLSAEEIRDYVLATSGLLNTEIGGPSVKPYQPPGLWEETNAGGNRGILTNYVEDSGDKLYRRSLYTFWKRTLPPPSMSIFDAPNRDLCEVRRQKTNTPLQALAMQNDIQVLEGSKVLAYEVTKLGLDDQGSIEKVFNKVLLRDPHGDEIDLLTDYYQDCLDKFDTNEKDAEILLEIGQKQIEVQNDKATAALMMVAQVLYNLDETITKE